MEEVEILAKKDIEKTHKDRNGDERNADEIEVPKAGMGFLSEEKVRNYYNNNERTQGFGVAKISTKSGDDWRQKYFALASARNGRSVSPPLETLFIQGLQLRLIVRQRLMSWSKKMEDSLYLWSIWIIIMHYVQERHDILGATRFLILVLKKDWN